MLHKAAYSNGNKNLKGITYSIQSYFLLTQASDFNVSGNFID